MTDLIWLHEDFISRRHPVFETAPEGAEAIFILDTEQMKDYSLKRIQFLYEAAIDAGCTIYKGDTAEILNALAPDTLYAPTSVNPWVQSTLYDLDCQVVRVPPIELVDLDNSKLDLKRFFRYWNKAKKQLMKA